jgi:hypothetical protein
LGRNRVFGLEIGVSIATEPKKVYIVLVRGWLVSEIEIVKRLYLFESTKSVADRLCRSEEAVITRAYSIGVRKVETYDHPPCSK